MLRNLRVFEASTLGFHLALKNDYVSKLNNFYLRQVEMDLLRLPMKGGAVDFGGTYEFIPLKDIKNNIKNNITDFISPSGDSKGLSSATFIMKDTSGVEYPTNIQSIDEIIDGAIYANIIGISWYAAMKLMNEFVNLDINESDEKLSITSKAYQECASKFFNLADVQRDKTKLAQNFAKAAIIGFIHGVHAYKLATSTDISEIPTINDTLTDRYKYVLDTIQKLKGKEKATIDGIWKALVRFNVKTTDEYEDPVSVLSETQKLQDFLNNEPNKEEDDGESISSDEDLDDIAFAFGIHEALLNFTEEAE